MPVVVNNVETVWKKLSLDPDTCQSMRSKPNGMAYNIKISHAFTTT
jgi:hypothetical protein